MDPRYALLADQLLLIERELRQQQWWAESPPSAEALASVEPFCVDTMAFEHWLQWVFLVRMKAIIEQGMTLPEVSGIRPMAEMAFQGRLAQARALLTLLEGFDQLIGGAASRARTTNPVLSCSSL